MGQSEEFYFVPLGGAGEIGMNMSLYGFGGSWIIVDCGITFGDDRTPGIDVMVPDISFLEECGDNLLAIVLTHAHEDHLGAIPYLWDQIGCPVYATPFASGFLQRKLPEVGLEGRIPIREVPCSGGIEIGPFDIELISLAHSIPETQALVINTPVGSILHATDWKLDDNPILGPVTDEAALRRIGQSGVIAMMCDSTNIFLKGKSGSEGSLRESLIKIVGHCSNRVAIACFASNVARMQSCITAAQANGRHVGLVGRSLWRMNEVARSCGYLTNCPEFLNVDEIEFLPRDKILMLVTGSQGEAQAALSRIASGDHRDLTFEKGDTVIFSSKEIPGNERAIGRVQNQLAKLGVEIITELDDFVHVSGHPAREELKLFYDWVKPPTLIPIHGENRHLTEHVNFATECGIPAGIIAENGSLLRLYPGPIEVIDQVRTGRLAVHGKRLIPVDGEIIRARRRIVFGGVAMITIVLDGKGSLYVEPQLSAPGLINGLVDGDEIREIAIEAIIEAIEVMPLVDLEIDDVVIAATVRAIRRVFREELGRRPMVEVHVVRV